MQKIQRIIMKTINFQSLELFLDLEKTKSATQDVKSQFANTIYRGTNGLEYHALAFKIFNSIGPVAYDEKECELIRTVANQMTPMFIDAIERALS